MGCLLIENENIQLKVKVKNWQEAIRAGGKLLLKSNYIYEAYIDAMIDTVKKFGPYIVIANGLALAHARPEDGVIKPGISFITLERPVCFGNKDNDPVYIVITLAGSDNGSHLKIIQKIATLFENEKIVEKIYAINEIAEILEIFGRAEEE
jgi:mannitol/fructose-specific phosphotransferase system IIA component (Ntr-type)